MKSPLIMILVLLAFTNLYAQETDPEFEKMEETKYKVGVGGMLYWYHYGLNINSRYKFKNKRELGLSIGGSWNKYTGRNFDHHFLVSFLPLKKRERKIGVDLVLSSGIYRQYGNYYSGKSEYITIPVFIGFDIYYNFYKDFILSANGNSGVGLGNFTTTGHYYHPEGSTTFIFVGLFELKYKIKGGRVKNRNSQ